MIPLFHKLIHFVASIGASVRKKISYIGKFMRLLMQVVLQLPYACRNMSLTLKQIHILGNYSVLIICVSGFFVGLVLALQGYYVLNRYGSEQILGLMVSLSLLRELGPVVSALLYAGRAGTALTAEIGLMKQGEQLTALEMMAINPISYILAPRFWAGVFTLPILAALFSAVGILGGYVVAVLLVGTDIGAFWSHMQAGISFEKDVLNGLLKALIFAVITNMVALYQGYYAKPTPEGVSKATTSTVVWSSLLILGFDFLLTAILFVN
jgi:phospholipid/cholesterol/gamma-HCH transport system permease protein